MRGKPAAWACTAWARPIAPPSAVAALLGAVFCGLIGATRTPRRRSQRHRPVTSALLPASEVVPWIIKVLAGIVCFTSDADGRAAQRRNYRASARTA